MIKQAERDGELLKKSTNGRPKKNASVIEASKPVELHTAISVASALKILRLTEEHGDAKQIKHAIIYTPSPEFLAACTLAGICTTYVGISVFLDVWGLLSRCIVSREATHHAIFILLSLSITVPTEAHLKYTKESAASLMAYMKVKYGANPVPGWGTHQRTS